MIKIPVDEGYAYDYLAILEVKLVRMNKGKEYYSIFYDELSFQVGKEKHQTIIQSQEYNNCVTVNLKCFDIVEAARYGTVSSKEVDDVNMERYNAKVALQKKFFDSEVIEVKS